MKKKIGISLSLILTAFVLFLLSILIPRIFGRRPFKDLTVEQVVSASVHLVPPDVTVEITKTEELVRYLREVVVYQKDDSYTEYCGQGVTFTIRYSDGSSKKVMAYNPFIIIDGTGYRCKYEPCQALNGYADRLMDLEKRTAQEEIVPEK